MLNFLRKLRRNDMNGKYLKYAIGEIILVVIGILIALQVNLWSQARKDTTKGQVILKSLLAEVENNLLSLDKSIDTNLQNKAAAERMAEYAGHQNTGLDEKQFGKLFGKAFKNEAAYKPALGVLKELISTGNLTLLKDQELRTTISSWEAKLQKVSYQEKQVETIRQRIYDFMMSDGNFRRLLDVTREDEPWYQLPQGTFERSNLALLTNPSFENNLVLFIGSSAYLDFSFYQEHKILLKKFKAQIKQGLKD